MPNFITPIHEFNPNHFPGGTEKGGQFAPSKTGFQSNSRAARRARRDEEAGDSEAQAKFNAVKATLRQDPEVAALADKIRKTAPTRAERRFAEFIANGEVENDRLLANGDSKTLHAPDGTYTPERSALHVQVLQDYIRDIPPASGQPVAIFMGGMTASGKTTTVERGLNKANKVYINADDLKAALPEYTGKNASYLHEESSDLADRAFLTAVLRRQSVILDSTMKSLGGVDYTEAEADGGFAAKIRKLKEAGYRVEVRFVDVPIEQSVERALHRYVNKELKDGKGRYVPLDHIRANANLGSHFTLKDRKKWKTKPRATFEKAKHKYDAYVIYDNSGSSPHILASEGVLTEGQRRTWPRQR